MNLAVTYQDCGSRYRVPARLLSGAKGGVGFILLIQGISTSNLQREDRNIKQ